MQVEVNKSLTVYAEGNGADNTRRRRLQGGVAGSGGRFRSEQQKWQQRPCPAMRGGQDDVEGGEKGGEKKMKKKKSRRFGRGRQQRCQVTEGFQERRIWGG